MTGVYQPDRGEILLSGQGASRSADPPRRSARHRRDLPGADALSRPQRRGEHLHQPPGPRPPSSTGAHVPRGGGDPRRARRARSTCGSPARGLTLAAQQTVEIAKAISLKVRVLIMDEPTASLSAHEVAQLFKLVRDLRDQGVAILFVSHRMEEVFEIADKVTVFRDGQPDLHPPARRGDAGAARSPTWSAARSAASSPSGPPRRTGEMLLAVAGLGRAGRLSRISASTCGAARCSASPASSAPAAPTSASRSSASRRRTSGTIVFDGKAGHRSGRRRQAHGHRHRLRLARTAASSASSMPMSISANITLPTLQRYLNRARADPTGEEDADGRGTSGSGSPSARVRASTSRRHALRRQPAEGHAEQVAQHPARAADPRRADARHRCRRQGRGPPHDRRARRPGHRRSS